MTVGLSALRGFRPESTTGAVARGIETLVVGFQQHMANVYIKVDSTQDNWKGEAARAANERALGERLAGNKLAAELEDIATAYRTHGSAMDGYRNYAVDAADDYISQGFTVADDGTVTVPSGKTDVPGPVPGMTIPMSAEQLAAYAADATARIKGLIGQFDAEDAALAQKAGQELLDLMQKANGEVGLGVQDHATTVGDRDDPSRLQTSAAAFQQVFGRLPTSPSDWTTAEILNPTSQDPKYQGTAPVIKVARIEPVPGQGVVRMGAYIPAADVFNLPDNDLGDNRDEDPNFDPEQTRVSTYIDYENGIVVTRQNPSVTTSGEVEVGEPDVRVQQLADGSVRLQYDAANPFAPPGSSLTGHTVNGDLVVSPTSGNPGSPRVVAGGVIGDYPSIEIYQDNSAGTSRPVLIDAADSGGEYGPVMNLPFHHEVGEPDLRDPFRADADPETPSHPAVKLGDPANPPTVNGHR
ncbi:hypothetical protein ACIBEH_01120 [Nocardia salmonicida]|uniref:hypothetical protein n=1 Tax=Nocardia salmonicida TaxID=53431 RepID=UPI00378D3E8F